MIVITSKDRVYFAFREGDTTTSLLDKAREMTKSEPCSIIRVDLDVPKYKVLRVQIIYLDVIDNVYFINEGPLEITGTDLGLIQEDFQTPKIRSFVGKALSTVPAESAA